MTRDEIKINGVVYVPSRIAARNVHLVPDYVTRLCRLGFVRGTRSQGIWYVDEASLREFLTIKQEHRKDQLQHISAIRRQELARFELRDIADSLHLTPVITVAPPALHAYHRKMKSRVNAKRRAVSITVTGIFAFATIVSAMSFHGDTVRVALRSLTPPHAVLAAVAAAGDSVDAWFMRTLCPQFSFCTNDSELTPAGYRAYEPVVIYMKSPTETGGVSATGTATLLHGTSAQSAPSTATTSGTTTPITGREIFPIAPFVEMDMSTSSPMEIEEAAVTPPSEAVISPET